VATLKTRIEGTILVVEFQDISIIDETRIQAVGTELQELISKSDQKKFILCFDNVEFMSSAMIGKLVQFGNTCKQEKIALRLCDITPSVKKVFDLMRLDKLFNIDKDVDSSMSKLAHGGWFAQ